MRGVDFEDERPTRAQIAERELARLRAPVPMERSAEAQARLVERMRERNDALVAQDPRPLDVRLRLKHGDD